MLSAKFHKEEVMFPAEIELLFAKFTGRFWQTLAAVKLATGMGLITTECVTEAVQRSGGRIKAESSTEFLNPS